MADTAAKTRGREAYYSTSRALGTGTTSTITMQIWRLLNDHLTEHQSAISGSELSQATGLSIEEIDAIFTQEYYQKHYGFRRFDSFEAWNEWATTNGTLFNPELHDQPEDEAPAAGEEAGEAPKEPQA